MTDTVNNAQTKTSNGTTVETNKPTPPKGQNSSNAYQSSGSSIAKPAQGVLADTMTELNNLIPTSGCPIKLPNTMNKLTVKLQLFIQTETERLKAWAEKLVEFTDPLVEDIKLAIEDLKQMIKEIEGYVKEIMEVVKDIQQFIQDVVDFVNFVMSLPARLMQLIVNCMNELKSGVTNFVTNSFDSPPNTTNTTVPVNQTTGSYSQPPALPTQPSS